MSASGYQPLAASSQSSRRTECPANSKRTAEVIR